MTIAKILEKAPHAAKILIENGMGCIGCHMAAMETLEEGAKAHGMTDEDLDKIEKLLNKKDE
jgi:hybrid cluster-associated redox disulfide protein